MKRIALLGFTTLLGIWMFSDYAVAHDWYTGTLIPGGPNKGFSCCNQMDFKPVKAWQVDGKWHALYPGKDGNGAESFTEYTIPDELILDDSLNKEPFQAHLAVHNGEVRCFMRKAAGG